MNESLRKHYQEVGAETAASAFDDGWDAAIEACAKVANKAGGFDHGDYTAVGNVVGFILTDIRALSTAKAKAATTYDNPSDPALD